MKAISKLLVVAMLLSMLGAFGVPALAEDTSVTLRLFSMSPEFANGITELADDFSQDHPGFKVETTVVSGVAEYHAALAAKLAAGDIPDLMSYQWSTQIQLYAKGGYLQPLTDLGIESSIATIKKPVNKYKGETYAYPGVQAFWGMFWNADLAAKYGVTELPKCMDEWVAALETMRKNGLEFPYLVAGKDGSGATAFIFAYLHETVAGLNPNFYAQTLSGEKGWNSPEIKEMLEQYARVLEYTPKDTLGMDVEEMKRRFAREEAVCLINGSGMIASLREMNPDFDFVLAPAPCVIDPANYMTISDFDTSFSIGKNAPLVAREFFKYCYTVHGGEVIARNMTSISCVLGANPGYDSALDMEFPFLESNNFVGFSEREWIPGIKEIMKKNVQDWMSENLSMEQAMESWNAEHLRLLEATPEFKEDFMQLKADTIK